MKVSASGIIYKTFNYSDKSAISIAYTKEFGKIKLFMNKIYSKKGGVFKFIPGEIVFKKKTDTDLHKFYQFNQYSSFFHFIDIPDIYLRLHLIFEIYDILNDVELPYPYFWQLLTGLNKTNYVKGTIYIILSLIENSGIMFNANQCALCSEELCEAFINNKNVVCRNCCNKSNIKLTKSEITIIQNAFYPEIFKKIIISPKEENNLLFFLISYINVMENVKIKGFEILRNLQFIEKN